MASQVFSFVSASEDLATFKVVDVDPSEGNYAQANAGHQAVKFDVLVPDMGAEVQVSVAWADCDTNKNNAILGVTKYITFDGISGSRRSGLANTSGLYLADLVSLVDGSKFIVRTTGIGPCIDLRSSPRTGIKRLLLVGFTFTDLPSITPMLVIATPTKIV